MCGLRDAKFHLPICPLPSPVFFVRVRDSRYKTNPNRLKRFVNKEKKAKRVECSFWRVNRASQPLMLRAARGLSRPLDAIHVVVDCCWCCTVVTRPPASPCGMRHAACGHVPIKRTVYSINSLNSSPGGRVSRVQEMARISPINGREPIIKTIYQSPENHERWQSIYSA